MTSHSTRIGLVADGERKKQTAGQSAFRAKISRFFTKTNQITPILPVTTKAALPKRSAQAAIFTNRP